MIVKPGNLVDRENEWQALVRFADRGQRLAVVYGPRRVGKSFLLDALCEATGGYRYQAITGTPAAQLADLGRALGSITGVGDLYLSSWADALGRFERLDLPVLVLDELPYLTEATPELPSLLQRHVDAGTGPPLVLAGSSLSTMADLVSARAPLYGRASSVVVPAPMRRKDLLELWGVDSPVTALWIDAAIGGLPGYRPMLAQPGDDLDAWMVEDVLAPSSPLLDASEALLAEANPRIARGLYRTILTGIAQGNQTFSGITQTVGQPSGALTRPLAALERAGMVVRVPDPLRSKRDLYDLADPHLRMWLAIIAPSRTQLQGGDVARVWERVRATTWRDKVLGPRWENVAREQTRRQLELSGATVTTVGQTRVADRKARKNVQIDIVVTQGHHVTAIGEAKLREMRADDLDRLRRIRSLMGATTAKLVLASATGVDETVARDKDVIVVTPSDVYC